eukprot:5606218-Prymnesium_polylepis.1
MHGAATAAVSCPASRAARSSTLATARWKRQDNRWTACAEAASMCILRVRKFILALMGRNRALDAVYHGVKKARSDFNGAGRDRPGRAA